MVVREEVGPLVARGMRSREANRGGGTRGSALLLLERTARGADAGAYPGGANALQPKRREELAVL